MVTKAALISCHYYKTSALKATEKVWVVSSGRPQKGEIWW